MEHRLIVISQRRDSAIEFARHNRIELGHLYWVGQRVHLYGLRTRQAYIIGALDEDLREAVRSWADHVKATLTRVHESDTIEGKEVCGPDC